MQLTAYAYDGRCAQGQHERTTKFGVCGILAAIVSSRNIRSHPYLISLLSSVFPSVLYAVCEFRVLGSTARLNAKSILSLDTERVCARCGVRL